MTFTNLFLAIFTSVICLIISEMIYRTISPQFGDMRISMVPSEISISTLEANIIQKLILPANGEPSFYLTTNSLGLRSSQDISFQVPEKTKRVLCLGDSYTFGFGVEEKYTYPSYLEKLLNSISDSDYRFQVINAGFTDGMSTDSQYLYLREIGVKFSPSIVLLGFTIANDLIDLRNNKWVVEEDGSLKRIFNPKHLLIPAFIRKSALFTAVRTHLTPTRVKEKNVQPVDTEMMDKVKLLLNWIQGLCREKGFKFWLLIIPPPQMVNNTTLVGSWNAIREELIKFSEEKKISYIDLLPELETHHFFPEKAHFTNKGNKRVAEVIYNKLINLGATEKNFVISDFGQDCDTLPKKQK